jgi:hypothetical protein
MLLELVCLPTGRTRRSYRFGNVFRTACDGSPVHAISARSTSEPFFLSHAPISLRAVSP